MRPLRADRSLKWRYAFGELILIVAGVMIALAASDWNEGRQLRQQEVALLAEIRSGLLTDLSAFESGLQTARAAESQIVSLQNMLGTTPPYDAAMDELFGAVYGMRSIQLNTASYDTLKSFGLYLVSDDQLRLGIARIYDYHYDRIDSINRVEVEINLEVFRPYYLENFRDIRFRESATPRDYNKIISDTYYRNLVDYRLSTLRVNQIEPYAETIEEIEIVMKMLDRELGDRSGTSR